MAIVPFILLSGCSSNKESTPGPDSTAAQPAASARRLAEAYIDAWNRHDSAATDTLIAADGTHEDVPSGTAATGPAGIRALMRDFLKSQPDYVWTVTDGVDGPSKATVIWTWKSTYTGPNLTGKVVTNFPMSVEGAALVVVENGKIKRLRNYYDEASLFRTPKT